MLSMRQFNSEVFFTEEAVTNVTEVEIEFLKARAASSPRLRSRLCAHQNPDDLLHDMLIVLASGAYVRPHRHLAKSESFQIVEGNMLVVKFDDQGVVRGRFRMGPYGSGAPFFHRLSGNPYHSVIPESDFVVFHEATSGPFRADETLQAEWAPTENDRAEVITEFLQRVNRGAR